MIHHAQLGSMESNVFTLIGNRMKGGRACRSIDGGNNLAALLCRYHTAKSDYEIVDTTDEVKPILSAAKVKASVGKGYEPKQMSNIPASMKWLKSIADIKSFTDLKY